MEERVIWLPMRVRIRQQDGRGEQRDNGLDEQRDNGLEFGFLWYRPLFFGRG
jgi:hypothetical protein